MELCVQDAAPLSQERGKYMISTAPSVPTHDPAGALEDIEQASISAQTTTETSQDGDRVFDSSSIPSNTGSTAASSVSQPCLTGSQAQSTSNPFNLLHPQDQVVFDSIQVISIQLHEKQPSLVQKLAKGSKIWNNVESQDKDDGTDLKYKSRQPLEVAQTLKVIAGTDDHIVLKHNPTISSDIKSRHQPDQVQPSPETPGSTIQVTDVQAGPMCVPKLTQVSKGKHPLFRYTQKAYISPTMSMNQDVIDRWELQIKPRLEDAICQTMHDVTAADGSLSIHCLMAGHTELK